MKTCGARSMRSAAPPSLGKTYCRRCGNYLPDLTEPAATTPEFHVKANLVLGLLTVLTHARAVGGIGVAVANNPGGPFKDYLGKPLINKFYNNAQPIDQYVFRDQDGQFYIIYGGWGRCNVGKLNESFTGLVPFPDGKLVKEITPKGYVEGPTMFIRQGKYYLMWSEGNWTDGTYKVAYAVSDNVLGPFERKGAILQADEKIATGAGHHSVIHIPDTDEWYIVYHRRPIPGPRQLQGRERWTRASCGRPRPHRTCPPVARQCSAGRYVLFKM